MAGQTYTKMQPGDRCIISVNDVNSPTGWWWGIVDTIEWHDDLGGWGEVKAHITGLFRVEGSHFEEPNYGTSNTKPSVNYTVYPANRETQGLAQLIVHQENDSARRIRDLSTRLDELRSLFRSMGGKVAA